MCGGKYKPCATCALGIGGCLTSMHEDNYCPASIEQVEERLKNGRFPNDKELMEKYVAYKKSENDYLEAINGKSTKNTPASMMWICTTEFCCADIR
jgi:hypothetical protein